MNNPSKYLLVLFIGLIPFYHKAQTVTDTLIFQMYDTWEVAYGSYNVDHLNGEISSAYEFLQLSDAENGMSDFQTDILLAESELQAKNWGLDLSAGYLYNTAAGMDVADNILYRSRIQTQLSWDVLNNGYLENQTKSKILACAINGLISWLLFKVCAHNLLFKRDLLQIFLR